MITLKDIKVSKNRIPVQNAIWIRPMGGLSFRLYYPHGGDWTEMKFDNSSSDPYPVPEDIDKRLKDLEDGLTALSKRVDRNKTLSENAIETITNNITKLQSETDKLNVSVARLYGSTKITTLLLTREFPESASGVEISDPAFYGIDNIYLNAIENEVVESVYFEEDGPYSVGYEYNSWGRGTFGSNVSRYICDMIKVDQENVLTARWIQTVKRNIQAVTISYTANSVQYPITENTVFIPNLDISTIYDKRSAQEDLPINLIFGKDEAKEWGITLDMVQRLGSGEEYQVFIGKQAVPYTAVGSTEEEEGSAYYSINLECNDLDYNAKKIITLGFEVVNLEFEECELDYTEEDVVIPEE